VTTLHIKGDLNFATVNQYLAEFKLLEDSNFKTSEEPLDQFKVDFSQAGAVDTAGIAFCLRIARVLKSHDASVVLLQASDRLKALLLEYKLNALFDYEA